MILFIYFYLFLFLSAFYDSSVFLYGTTTLVSGKSCLLPFNLIDTIVCEWLILKWSYFSSVVFVPVGECVMIKSKNKKIDMKNTEKEIMIDDFLSLSTPNWKKSIFQMNNSLADSLVINRNYLVDCFTENQPLVHSAEMTWHLEDLIISGNVPIYFNNNHRSL